MTEVLNLLNTLQYKENSVATRTLVEKEGGSLTVYAFDKTQGLGRHASPFLTCIQLIEGKAQITIDDKTNLVSENEIVTIPANVPFALHSIHKVKAILFRLKSSSK
ncbi:cupin domain-containing protein [bacterium]|nr:cupin domain-containing protein [bacterium]